MNDALCDAREQLKQLLRETDLAKQILLLATKLCSRAVSAEDLAQHAICVALEEETAPWNGTGEDSNLARFERIMKRERNRVAKQSYTRRRAQPTDENDPLDDVPKSDPQPDELTIAAREERELRARCDALEGRLDPFAKRAFREIRGGTVKPGEIADAIGEPVEKVYDAMDRIGRAGDAVIHDERRAKLRGEAR